MEPKNSLNSLTYRREQLYYIRWNIRRVVEVFTLLGVLFSRWTKCRAMILSRRCGALSGRCRRTPKRRHPFRRRGRDHPQETQAARGGADPRQELGDLTVAGLMAEHSGQAGRGGLGKRTHQVIAIHNSKRGCSWDRLQIGSANSGILCLYQSPWAISVGNYVTKTGYRGSGHRNSISDRRKHGDPAR